MTSNSSEYIEVKIELKPFTEEWAEIIEAEMAQLPYDSFVIEDPYLKCYIQKDLYDSMAVRVILGGYPDLDLTFSANLIKPQNWNNRWECEGFTPIVIENKVTVKSYLDVQAPHSRFNIKLNPQMAFGSGHHSTTRMMMETMLEMEENIHNKVVMDMGCGTGVLGILAAKMRSAKVYAIDIDMVATKSAFGNACLNRVSKKMEVYCGDASLLQLEKYDVLLANIHKNIILMDLKTYSMSLKEGGYLLLSGFYEEDAPEIISEASSHHLSLVSSKSSDNWVCLKLQKE